MLFMADLPFRIVRTVVVVEVEPDKHFLSEHNDHDDRTNPGTYGSSDNPERSVEQRDVEPSETKAADNPDDYRDNERDDRGNCFAIRLLVFLFVREHACTFLLAHQKRMRIISGNPSLVDCYCIFVMCCRDTKRIRLFN